MAKRSNGKRVDTLGRDGKRALAIERAISFLKAAAAQERSIFGRRGPSEWHTENFIERELSLLPAVPTPDDLRRLGADNETFDRVVDELVTEEVRSAREELEFVGQHSALEGWQRSRVSWSEEIAMETELVELRGQMFDSSDDSERSRLKALIAEKEAAKDERTRWPTLDEFKSEREMRRSLKDRLVFKSPTAVRKAMAEDERFGKRFGTINTIIDLAEEPEQLPPGGPSSRLGLGR